MPDPTQDIQIVRHRALEAGVKASAVLAELMLMELQQHHPEKAVALASAVGTGMRLAVQFVIAEPDPKVVLLLLDDYDRPTELGHHPISLTNIHQAVKN